MTSETEALWIASVPGVEESIPLLRRQAAARLGAFLPDPGELLLCLTEIATNALKHSDSKNGGEIVARLSVSEDEILVSVTDDGGAATYPRIPDEPGETCGRGLRLVEALAGRWGVHTGSPGTTVWFTFPR